MEISKSGGAGVVENSVMFYNCSILRMAPITINECIKRSSGQDKVICYKKKCQSPGRICPACAALGEVNEERIRDRSVFVKYPYPCCAYHKEYTPTAKRGSEDNTQTLQGSLDDQIMFILNVDQGEAMAAISRMVTPPSKIIKQVIELLCAEIRPYADQPRENFKEGPLKALADSIKNDGQKTPIRVRRLANDPIFKYELIDGERRWRAHKMIGKGTIDAIIENVESENEQHKTAFILNFFNETHTDLEIARALGKIKGDFEWDDKRLAKIIGKTPKDVRKYLSLLALDSEVQNLLEKKQLAFLVAIELAPFASEVQVKLANEIIEKRLKRTPALFYIRKRTKELKITSKAKKGGRGRKPSDNWNVLLNFLKRIHESMDIFFGFSESEFLNMLKFREGTEIESTLEDLEKIKARIDGLKDKILKHD